MFSDPEHPHLSEWISEVSAMLPVLSDPQSRTLAMYSFGAVFSKSCGLTVVAAFLATCMKQPFETVRERLRDWYCSASDKTGTYRREVVVRDCFGCLLAWILKRWHSTDLAIALDATSLGERFTVLSISVVYRSGAIPVAWAILPGNEPGSWRQSWLDLLKGFHGVVPSHLRVIVLTDRGLYAKWLYEAIAKLSWHPFMRIVEHRAEFRAEGTGGFHALSTLAGKVGDTYCAHGEMFRRLKSRLRCTLTAAWSEGYKAGWFVVTDLPAEEVNVAWYGLRAWIERGFKQYKSGGWNWQKTRMTDPARAERLWLVMAVAQAAVIRAGGYEEITRPEPRRQSSQTTAQGQTHADHQTIDKSHDASADSATPARLPRKRRKRRTVSTFLGGLVIFTAAAINRCPLPLAGHFDPEPWPTHMAPTQQRPVSQNRPP